MANLSFLLDDAAADHPAIRMDDLAALHHDFVRSAPANALTRAGAATMLGSPVDLSKVDVDAYVIVGISDHLCPWQSCYQTTQLLGGPVKFVLSTSGHIAMVNPPSNARASFRTAPSNPPGPAAARSYWRPRLPRPQLPSKAFALSLILGWRACRAMSRMSE